MIVLKWAEADSKEQLVGKMKEFRSRDALQKFILKLQEKDYFIELMRLARKCRGTEVEQITFSSHTTSDVS